MSFKMKYDITPMYIPSGTRRRSGLKMEKIRFSVLHDTGNEKSTALGNVNYYINSCNDMEASAHLFVDDKSIIECIPTGLIGNLIPEKAWHVVYNDTRDNEMFGYDSNDAAIGIELCFGSNIDSNKAYARYIWVCAYICYKYNLNPASSFVGHHLIQKGKIDPVNGLSKSGRTYEQLLIDIVSEYNDCINPNGGKEISNMPQIIKERIYVEWGELKSADGNYSIPATDVRYVKFDKDTYKLKLVWSAGKTVSQLVKEYGADYGFNFPFFWQGNPVGDCKINNTILSQGYDTVGGAQQTKWHGFAFKNGQPVIGQLNINDNYSDGFLVKTTPLLLDGQGRECWDWFREVEGTANDIGRDANGSLVRAQRTFVGLDAQGNLHLAVSDGRTQWDRGLDLEEMAKYMKSKGCIIALNGDGGGSSVIADKTGSLGQNQGASERVVGHAILVFMNPPAPEPEPLPEGTEQWQINILKDLSNYKQVNGEPFLDYDSWKNLLNANAPNWLVFELFRRVLQKLN